MKVHEAASLLGVTPRALRYYEEKGLLQPCKEAVNGYRLYGDEDLERLRWVIALRELGLPIAAIQEVLLASGQPERWISKLDSARAALYSEWVTAKEALDALDATMAGWQQAGTPQLGKLEEAALKMKQNRLQRAAWRDNWNIDEYAASYGAEAPYELLKQQLTERQYRITLQQTTEWLEPRAGESGLELGAGSGNLTELIAASGAKLTAIEQSPQMLSLLRKRLPQVDAKLGNLLSLPLSEQAWSFVACSFAMQHLTHAQQLLALEEIDRVLKPGGRAVMAGFMIEDRIQETAGSASDLTQGFVHCSLKQLSAWFKPRGYSLLTQAVDEGIYILYAVKPEQAVGLDSDQES